MASSSTVITEQRNDLSDCSEESEESPPSLNERDPVDYGVTLNNVELYNAIRSEKEEARRLREENDRLRQEVEYLKSHLSTPCQDSPETEVVKEEDLAEVLNVADDFKTNVDEMNAELRRLRAFLHDVTFRLESFDNTVAEICKQHAEMTAEVTMCAGDKGFSPSASRRSGSTDGRIRQHRRSPPLISSTENNLEASQRLSDSVDRMITINESALEDEDLKMPNDISVTNNATPVSAESTADKDTGAESDSDAVSTPRSTSVYNRRFSASSSITTPEREAVDSSESQGTSLSPSSSETRRSFRRRSRINYREPSLTKKLRRGDTFFEPIEGK
ncbi:unnamed protein product [Soboliphyme baturini]|uniref:Uncharacterized protein n=1 Tax=Soboliphyme baturini TaxID=241478 RepID=A0A183IM38_9BILA|nr:unnamed protein product [Soboliphyme baturini]